MDYPCAEFGDFGLSRFDFIVRTDGQKDRQNNRQTDRQTVTDRQTDRIIDADDRHTHATIPSASVINRL